MVCGVELWVQGAFHFQQTPSSNYTNHYYTVTTASLQAMEMITRKKFLGHLWAGRLSNFRQFRWVASTWG